MPQGTPSCPVRKLCLKKPPCRSLPYGVAARALVGIPSHCQTLLASRVSCKAMPPHSAYGSPAPRRQPNPDPRCRGWIMHVRTHSPTKNSKKTIALLEIACSCPHSATGPFTSGTSAKHQHAPWATKGKSPCHLRTVRELDFAPSAIV